MFNKENLDQIQDIGIPTFTLRSGGRNSATPANLITDALPYIFGVAGIVLLFNIVTSGFKMMTSQGDPKVMQAAQAKLTTSAIGILILFASFWIVKLVMQFLGIDLTLFG